MQHPGYVNIEDGRWDENANFIAVARDLVPQLLAEVRRLGKDSVRPCPFRGQVDLRVRGVSGVSVAAVVG